MIVLTQANMLIAEGKKLQEKLDLWINRLRKYLVSEVHLDKQLAQSIQILPAGYATRLDQQAPGMSWINNILACFSQDFHWHSLFSSLY